MTNWITSDATGVTLHVPPFPAPPETALWMAAAGLALFLFLAILKARPGRKTLRRLPRSTASWLARHYVLLVFAGAGAICLWAAWIGLLRVPVLVDGLLHDLRENAGDPEKTRGIVIAMAAILAIITIFGTLIVQSIRVWINERAARTAEANLITGLINTAVEGLGTEKRGSRIGRPVTLSPRDIDDPANSGIHTIIEWQGDDAGNRDDWQRVEGEWQTFDSTAPNLEVRIGAILTLERIARDNPADHIRVMDILCAYIRENSPARDARDHSLGDWPELPESMTQEEVELRAGKIKDRTTALNRWADALAPPRTDIQVAIEVIGRRSIERIDGEEAAEIRAGIPGYRIDLARTNLQRSNLSHLDFRRANFIEARLEGADLTEARLERAFLSGAWLERADIDGTRLEGANLRGARLERAFLGGARLEGAFLGGARLEGAYLGGALEGAILGGARLEGSDQDVARLGGRT